MMRLISGITSEESNKYLFGRNLMRKLGVVVLCLLFYVMLHMYINSTGICSVSNTDGQCGSDTMSEIK